MLFISLMLGIKIKILVEKILFNILSPISPYKAKRLCIKTDNVATS